MRILFVSNLYPPNVVGGYERLCHEVASALAVRGHQVSVLTSSWGGREAVIPGQTVHRTLRLLANPDNIYAPFTGDAAERFAIHAGNVTAFRRAVALERPEVIFAWNLYFLEASLLDSLRETGCRVVFMLTDNWLVASLDGEFVGRFFRDHVFNDLPFPRPRPPAWKRWFRRSSEPEPRHFPQPHDAVFGARFMRDFYSEAGVTFRDSRVIHNGVRLPDIPAERYVSRERLQVPGELRLLFAGRIVDIKGVHTAVEALAHLSRDGHGSQPVLTIVGDRQDAAYAARLQETIDRCGCANQVHFVEPVAEEALFALFQQHDLYLFPSLYEPFSLTLIHALAAGIPTVASRTGGNGEIVTDGVTGLLFSKGEPADLARRIARLRDDSALRVRLASEARRFSRGFTFERMVDGMETYLLAGPLGTASSPGRTGGNQP